MNQLLILFFVLYFLLLAWTIFCYLRALEKLASMIEHEDAYLPLGLSEGVTVFGLLSNYIFLSLLFDKSYSSKVGGNLQSHLDLTRKYFLLVIVFGLPLMLLPIMSAVFL